MPKANHRPTTAKPRKKGLRIERKQMTDYTAHVGEAIQALGQSRHCVATSWMVGWGEECVRDLEEQTRNALVAA
jgi:predicted thioesterase